MAYDQWLTTPKEWYRLRPIAQARRTYPTPHQAVLWERLRRRQIHRMEFRRQEAIGSFLVDFFCRAAMLGVVIDDPNLSGHLRPGAVRTRCFEELEVLELRFTNEEIDRDLDDVVRRIASIALARRRAILGVRANRPEPRPWEARACLYEIERSVRREPDHACDYAGDEPTGGTSGETCDETSGQTSGETDGAAGGGLDRAASERRVLESEGNYRQWQCTPRQWRRIRHRVRELRHNPTPAERVLWSRLRNRQLDGLAFRRQMAIDAFIADFYCPEARLVLELDGPIHDAPTDHDDARTEALRARGLTVLRITNDDALTRTAHVLSRILKTARNLHRRT